MVLFTQQTRLRILLLLVLTVSQAQAYAGVLVATIERVIALSWFDSTCFIACIKASSADFYAFVTLDGREEGSDAIDDEDDISPNWRFSNVVDLTKGAFAVSIQIYDSDGGTWSTRGADDVAHLDANGDTVLSLQVVPDSQSPPITGCQISGSVSGRCGDTIVTRGTAPGDTWNSDNAEIHFKVEILDISSVNFKEWDIIPGPDGFDINHLLLNPQWGWQQDLSPGLLLPNFDDCTSTDACTQQFPLIDVPTSSFQIPGVCHFNFLPGFGLGSADGHLNWEVVSYTGIITYDSHSSDIFGDGDYNFFLETPSVNGAAGAGATQGDPNHVKLEMKDTETIDNFGNIFWWSEFAIDASFDDTNPMGINGAKAIAIGLLGLDRVHPPSGSELHPTYALAINIKPDVNDDTWVLFARNYGNEGMCCSKMHYADFGDLTLQIPRPAGVPPTAVPEITFQKFVTKAGGLNPNPITIELSTGAGQDTFVTIKMNSLAQLIAQGDAGPLQFPSAREFWGDRASGQFSLNWEIGSSRRFLTPALHDRENEMLKHSNLSLREDGGGEPEDILRNLFNSLTSDQKVTYKAMFPTIPPPVADAVTTASLRTGVPPATPRKPVLFGFEDPSQQRRLQDILRSFCGASGGSLGSGLPDCSGYPPFTRLDYTGTPNANGWHKTPVTVTLIGINANGKGINHVEYQLNSQNFIQYSEPFKLPEGTSTVFYRSQDGSGTFESTKQATFRIDTIPPQILLVIGQPQYAPGPPLVVSVHTPFTLSGSDSGSGISSVAYRFYEGDSHPPSFSVINSQSFAFMLSGPDGIYHIDSMATDVAGNVAIERQSIRLSHVADLAIVVLELVTPPPPFAVVDSPIQLSLRTDVTNLGFVNPVNVSLEWTVTGTANMTVTPKDISTVDSIIGLNQPRSLREVYTVACQRRSANTVVFSGKVELSGPAGAVDDIQANNQKSLSVPITCKVPWKPGVFYKVGDEVVCNGLVYVCRQAHTSQTGWEPLNTYALWQRTPVQTPEGSEWAPQVIYQIGDVVVFEGHHYRAIEAEQALENWTPSTQPALWQRID